MARPWAQQRASCRPRSGWGQQLADRVSLRCVMIALPGPVSGCWRKGSLGTTYGNQTPYLSDEETKAQRATGLTQNHTALSCCDGKAAGEGVCLPSPCPHLYLGEWFSSSVTLPPRGHVAVSGDILVCLSLTRGVVRRQGCSQTSYNAPDSPLQQNVSAPKCHGTKVKKP